MLKIIDGHVVNISEIIAVKRVSFDTEIYFKGGCKVVLPLKNIDHKVLLNHVRDYSLGDQQQSD